MTAKQELIAARLAKIAEECGGNLTPDAVLEDARSKKSPLHDQFEWNDGEAAHKYRLDQARTLIRSVRVEVVTESKTVSVVRYLRNPEAPHREQGYADVVAIKDESDLARDALLAELARAKALFDRAESLALAFSMDSEIRELRDRVIGMDSRLRKRPGGDEAQAA